MRVRPVAAISFLLFLVTGASAAEKKQPWQWTLEERLAARFGLNGVPGVPTTTTPSGNIQVTIRGADNPELFTPMELFSSFIDGAYGIGTPETQVAHRNRIYRAARQAGFPDTFWQDIAEEAGDLIVLVERNYALLQRISHVERSQRYALSAERAGVEAALCPARARALARIRARYGGERFDELLYRTGAPSTVLSWTGPVYRPEEIAEVLRRVERGCE